MNYLSVAVNVPLVDSILTYMVPEELINHQWQVGQLIEVPIGKRVGQGIIIEVNVDETKIDPQIKPQIKPIVGVLDENLQFDLIELELYKWMAKYYHYSLGQLIFDCLPRLLKRPRPIEFIQGENHPLEHQMNSDQQKIFDEISKQVGFKQNLIHGVTGSGKTLVYMNLILKTLKENKSALFLLPEINLTPQFIHTFSKYLNCKILSYHSGITNSEKYQIWRYLSENDGPILVMGVRSSVFLPIHNLGLVIVDEEHDSSFKQDSRCPYNARDVAIKKAQLANAPVVLGSATPTMETYFRFKSGSNYFTLKNRAASDFFPEIVTVDIRSKTPEDVQSWPISEQALTAIKEKLAKKEQVLVFINKLGFANYIQCRACGHHFVNKDCGCNLNLRFFKNKNILSCSHCEFKMPLPESCPECGNLNLLQKGFGTERVHEVLSNLLPEARVERFDRDEIKNFEQLNQTLERFHNGLTDILVGTQMLSKGHNFQKVNLVVILGVDAQLNFADFRANEKSYQLITQVAGRSGRYSPKSQVLIQTANPDHNLFDYLKEHSFEGFYQNELGFREVAHVPPFAKLATIFFTSKDRNKLMQNIQSDAQSMRQLITNKNLKLELLGPIPSFIEKKSGQFTWMIMLKSNDVGQLHQLLHFFNLERKKEYQVSVKIDVDPY